MYIAGQQIISEVKRIFALIRKDVLNKEKNTLSRTG